jgi:hypothetical protein
MCRFPEIQGQKNLGQKNQVMRSYVFTPDVFALKSSADLPNKPAGVDSQAHKGNFKTRQRGPWSVALKLSKIFLDAGFAAGMLSGGTRHFVTPAHEVEPNNVVAAAAELKHVQPELATVHRNASFEVR